MAGEHKPLGQSASRARPTVAQGDLRGELSYSLLQPQAFRMIGPHPRVYRQEIRQRFTQGADLVQHFVGKSVHDG
jgi:hypothetical protein